ncbi:hypothetical protein PFLUV_G00072600 [Perca fluviatilis]|uniref:Uncharacterized protein n=1 Tax=Perca fluviatilis TaxID=8168 RepID=A0A6A5FAY0_PERFL|nr:hypothetical protein PFLUV_G00072600 [Perca fluviatilis]
MDESLVPGFQGNGSSKIHPCSGRDHGTSNRSAAAQWVTALTAVHIDPEESDAEVWTNQPSFRNGDFAKNWQVDIRLSFIFTTTSVQKISSIFTDTDSKLTTPVHSCHSPSKPASLYTSLP